MREPAGESKGVRGRITYANVVATLALFVALGGAGYAAVNLPKNSVGSKEIKKRAVKKAELANRAVTDAKLATQARQTPTLENCVAGTPWTSGHPGMRDPHYWKDPDGVVHLDGAVSCSGSPTAGAVIFVLPAAYRPAEPISGFAMLAPFGSLAQVTVVR